MAGEHLAGRGQHVGRAPERNGPSSEVGCQAAGARASMERKLQKDWLHCLRQVNHLVWLRGKPRKGFRWCVSYMCSAASVCGWCPDIFPPHCAASLRIIAALHFTELLVQQKLQPRHLPLLLTYVVFLCSMLLLLFLSWGLVPSASGSVDFVVVSVLLAMRVILPFILWVTLDLSILSVPSLCLTRANHSAYCLEFGVLLMDLNNDRLALRCFNVILEEGSSRPPSPPNVRRHALLLKAICSLNESTGDPLAEVSSILEQWWLEVCECTCECGPCT